MKIIITEEQNKKLFIPRNIDTRQEQLKKLLGEKTKEIISRFNITEIMLHGRIDDYDEEISAEHLDGSYEKLIIGGKNYYGFPRMVNIDKEIINITNDWENMLATYLNTILPQPSEESINKASPNVVSRMFRVDINPSKIDISFSYSIVEYNNKNGNETITL
jgi:hypothetical protein